jgi:hypothetical protein
MTDAELAEALPGIRFILARLELLLRSLALGPELDPVMADLLRTARILTPILRAWSDPPSLSELGFSCPPMSLDHLSRN